MNLLQRYLKQVEKYLPIKDRKDTLMELENLILEEVDEQISLGANREDAIYTVIQNMGTPIDIASQYGDARILISKELEPILMLVLKIVSLTFPFVILFAKTLDFMINNTGFTLMELVLNITYSIPSALYTLVMSIGFIFIVFVLIERFIQPKFEIEEKPFHPELLPDIPAKVYKVSLFGSILSVLITILVVYLFNMQEGLIAVTYNNVRYPLFNSNFEKLLPWLNIGWLASISIHLFYAFKRRKNLTTKTLELLQGIYSGIVVLLIGTSNIFNSIIIEGYDLEFLPNMIRYVLVFIGIIIIIASIFEYIILYINLDQLDKLDKKNKEAKH